MTLGDLRDLAAQADVTPPPGCEWGPWTLGYNGEAMFARALLGWGGRSVAVAEMTVATIEGEPNDEARIVLLRAAQDAACTQLVRFTMERDA